MGKTIEVKKALDSSSLKREIESLVAKDMLIVEHLEYLSKGAISVMNLYIKLYDRNINLVVEDNEIFNIDVENKNVDMYNTFKSLTMLERAKRNERDTKPADYVPKEPRTEIDEEIFIPVYNKWCDAEFTLEELMLRTGLTNRQSAYNYILRYEKNNGIDSELRKERRKELYFQRRKLNGGY